jgi:hypothetical protein
MSGGRGRRGPHPWRWRAIMYSGIGSSGARVRSMSYRPSSRSSATTVAVAPCCRAEPCCPSGVGDRSTTTFVEPCVNVHLFQHGCPAICANSVVIVASGPLLVRSPEVRRVGTPTVQPTVNDGARFPCPPWKCAMFSHEPRENGSSLKSGSAPASRSQAIRVNARNVDLPVLFSPTNRVSRGNGICIRSRKQRTFSRIRERMLRFGFWRPVWSWKCKA